MARPPRHAEFFRVWTPEMAYVLGLWWTDGCMRIKSNTGAHEFEIASNDREHLETIAQTIGGNYGLRKVFKDSQCYKITFCSKEIYQDILAHGGTPHKSRTIGFPYVPRNYRRTSCAVLLMEMERWRGMEIDRSFKFIPAHRCF